MFALNPPDNGPDAERPLSVIRENSDVPTRGISTRKKSVRNSISVHFRRREMSLTEETGRRISQTTSSRYTAPFIPRRAKDWKCRENLQGNKLYSILYTALE